MYTTKYNAQHEYVHATILRLLRRSACIIGIRDDQRWSECVYVQKCVRFLPFRAHQIQGEVCRSHPRSRATLLGLSLTTLTPLTSLSLTFSRKQLESIRSGLSTWQTSNGRLPFLYSNAFPARAFRSLLNLSCGKLCCVNDSRIQFAMFLEFLACSRQCGCWFGDCESLRSNLWLLGVAYKCLHVLIWWDLVITIFLDNLTMSYSYGSMTIGRTIAMSKRQPKSWCSIGESPSRQPYSGTYGWNWGLIIHPDDMIDLKTRPCQGWWAESVLPRVGLPTQILLFFVVGKPARSGYIAIAICVFCGRMSKLWTSQGCDYMAKPVQESFVTRLSRFRGVRCTKQAQGEFTELVPEWIKRTLGQLCCFESGV